MEEELLKLSPCQEIYFQNSDLFENFENYLKWEKENQIDAEHFFYTTNVKNEQRSE
jgi:hypothetical protein